MPADHLLREVGKYRNALGYKEFVDLKRLYRVSGVALLMRLRQLDVITEPTLVYAFQTIARGWRTQEPEELETSQERGQRERARRFERLCYRALAEGLISLSKAAELLQAAHLRGRSRAERAAACRCGSSLVTATVSIDLSKVSLLDTFSGSPIEFLIPNTLFEEELISFSAVQKEALLCGGLKVIDLPGTQVLRRAQEECGTHPTCRFTMGSPSPWPRAAPAAFF